MKQKDINIGDKFGIYEVLGELQRTKTIQSRRFLVKCEVCGATNLSINKDNLTLGTGTLTDPYRTE